MKLIYIVDAPGYTSNKKIMAFENVTDAKYIAEKLHGEEYAEKHVEALPLFPEEKKPATYGFAYQAPDYKPLTGQGAGNINYMHRTEVDHGDE